MTGSSTSGWGCDERALTTPFCVRSGRTRKKTALVALAKVEAEYQGEHPSCEQGLGKPARVIPGNVSVCTHVSLCEHVYVFVCLSVCLCVCVCVFVSVPVPLSVCAQVFLCLSLMCTCVGRGPLFEISANLVQDWNQELFFSPPPTPLHFV